MSMAMENGKCPMTINCSRWCTHLLDIVPTFEWRGLSSARAEPQKKHAREFSVKKSEKIRKTSKSDHAKRVKKHGRKKQIFANHVNSLLMLRPTPRFLNRVGSVSVRSVPINPVRRNCGTDCPTREMQTAPRSWVLFATQERRTLHLIEEFRKSNYWHRLLACNDEIQLTLRFAQFSLTVSTSSQRQDTWPPHTHTPSSLAPIAAQMGKWVSGQDGPM